MALNQANKIGRKLTVVGDPYNGKGSKLYNKFMEGYGCGDETVDLTGAKKCPNGIKSDILSFLKTLKDNSRVIFISYVLEYVDNIDETIKEIYRVAGSNDNIFVATVSDKSLYAYIYSDDEHYSKNIIYAPPQYKNITYKSI